MKNLAKRIILTLVIMIFIVAMNTNCIYAYFSADASVQSNEEEIDIYGAINTEVKCTVTDENKAKITLKNNGFLVCETKVKVLLPSDVTYTIEDSDWTVDEENWVKYNNTIAPQEIVELNINLNIPANKNTRFNISVIEESNPATVSIMKKAVVNNVEASSDESYTCKPLMGSIVASIYQDKNEIARKIKIDADNWEVYTQENWKIANENLKIGREYPLNLKVYNYPDVIEQYVRATISFRWIDKDGKINQLAGDDNMVDLEYGEDWIRDKKDAYSNRIILYNTKKVSPAASTSNFLSSIKLNEKIWSARNVTSRQENGATINTIRHNYEGKFMIDINIDSVQTHSAVEAIKSVWGRDVKVNDDGTIELL